MKLILNRLLPYLKKYKKYYLYIFTGIILTAIGTVSTAHIIQPILDDIFIAKNSEALYTFPFLIFFIYLIKSVGRYISGYFTNAIGESVIMSLRNEMLDKILHFDLTHINSIRNGELMSRISGDIGRVKYVVSEMLPELSRESVTALGLIGYVIYQNPLLSFYTLVILPATFYPLSILSQKMRNSSKISQERSADLISRLSEIFNNIEIIKANSKEKFELSQFEKDGKSLLEISLRSAKIYQFVSPMMEMYSSLSISLVIIFGGRAVIDGEMSVGSFFAFLTAIGLLFDPIKKISAILNRMQDGISATERIFQIIDIEPEVISGNIKIDNVNQIKFKDVSFSFGENKILSNINFEIKKGETFALIGESGGGKSSVLNLIIRFFDKNSGELLINNIDIEQISLASLREHISFVSQRVYLFNDSVAKNVAYGDEVDSNRVIEALKNADAFSFVEDMGGINAEILQFGNNLSGGQRQRISIARALYKKSSILILDEATSALDNSSERKILENIKKYTENKIVITVAHRLSTISKANKIAIFTKGTIIAIGNHEELLANSNEYKILNQKH
jgi:subfamily B ATP-binding cassette protein MsbA